MRRPARVVVGVDHSPAGLRALRAAVAQARFLQRELFAVRVYMVQSDRQAILMVPAVTVLPSVTAEERTSSCRARERAALQAIERAFDQAMGGVPGNIRVRPMASFGVPGPVLVGLACQDDDLLVVGTSSRRFRPFRRCVASYCTSHAGCSVLLVPPNDFAREVHGMHRRRRWRQFDELLSKSAPT